MSIFSTIGNNVGKIGGFMAGGPIGGLIGNSYDNRNNGRYIDPYSGMPASPAYPGAMTGDILKGYSAAGRAGTPSQVGINALRTEATRPGQSPWATMANQQVGQQAAGARQKVARDVASQQAGAASGLAMRGGLQSGARERLAKSGAQSKLALNQDIARQEAGNRLQVGTNAEQNRLSLVSQLPGADIQMAGAQRTAALTPVMGKEKELERQMGWNQNLYNQQMAAWAANKQAQATAAAAPNKGFLGLW